MKYYVDKNSKLLANPLNISGMVEVTNPIWDGRVLPNHDNLQLVEKQADGTYYKYYLSDGKPDLVRISDEEQQSMNNKALHYLSSTDWYITRLMETSIAVPKEVLTARAEARASIV